MKWFLNTVIFLLFWGNPFAIFSQDLQQDLKIAMNYYNNGDFDKAVLYFEKIAASKNKLDIYLPYKTSLIALNELKSAEKLVKQELKKFPNKFHLLVDLGKVYEYYKKDEKANGFYDAALKKIDQKSTNRQIQQLATAFDKQGMIDRSLQAYLLGNKYNQNKLIYNQKIAVIYNRKGETELMIKAYLDLIALSSGYLSVVERSLSNSIDLLDDPKTRTLLKTALITKSQKFPNKIVYNELLAWYFTAVNDFSSAFIQVRAIDKKTNAEGAKLFEFGESCYINESYDVALKAYDEIINNYSTAQITGKAKAKKLKTLKAKLLSGSNIPQEELLILKQNYLKTIEEIKLYFKNYQSDSRYIEAVRGLADLQAYYLYDYNAAEQLLETLVNSFGVSIKSKGEIKIELADILLAKGAVWEASLRYMQVEKQFKEDPIGYQAKFNNARIYYYTGEYDWCQAQLDVLKASTSKLIANDAMELSLLITDNFNLDTSKVSMNLFAQADLLIVQHKYDEAEQLYDSINSINGFHSLNDDILLRRAKIALKKQDYNKAITHLQKILLDYSDDILADNALFLMGNIYQYHLYDLDKAKAAYKNILFNYQGSLFVVQARKQFRKLSGKKGSKIENDT